MTARITPRPPEELDVDERVLYDTITGGPRANGPQYFSLTAPDGSLRGPFDAFLLSPAVGVALQELGAAIRYRTHLDDRCRELAILLVAAHWGSAFEREAHEAVARALGFDEPDLAALQALDVSRLEGTELAVARAVISLLAGDLDDDSWTAISHELGTDGVFELTSLVGYYATLALQLRVFRVGD